MREKTLEEIFSEGRSANDIIADLKHKTIALPAWKDLEKEYNPRKHPVMDVTQYPDKVEDGVIHKVSRVAFNTQKLAVKRMVGLCFGVPAEINFKPADNNDKQKTVAMYLRTIFERVRINSVNIERAKQLFAACEVFTLWYGVKQRTREYGFDSDIKLRCRTFSPMNGDELYPLFDAYGDLIAFSIGYKEHTNEGSVEYFDTYTSDRHYRWVNDGGGFVEDTPEEISIGKIPGVYTWRPESLWEDTSPLVYEREWKMSRNGNYLDKNNKPIVAVYSDDPEIISGKEEDDEARSILQLPTDSKMEYITWEQAIESLKFYDSTLKSSIFEQLQIPNWSYEDMKAVQTSGEGLKQLFIDAHLKVVEESGRLVEMLDREVNVVKAFLKVMLDNSYTEAIEELKFECIITPYAINDEKEHINNLMLANGNKPIMSHRESVERAGYSADVDETMRQIAEDSVNDALAL